MSAVALLEVKRGAEYYLEGYLMAWASWMRRSSDGCLPGRCPRDSCGGIFQGYATLDRDSMKAMDKMEHSISASVDSIIQSLAPAPRCALNHAYLHAVYRFPRVDYSQALAAGKRQVEAGLRRRHVWLGE